MDRFLGTMQRGVGQALDARDAFMGSASRRANTAFPSLMELAGNQKINQKKERQKQREADRKAMQEADRQRRAAIEGEGDPDGMLPEVSLDTIQREGNRRTSGASLYANEMSSGGVGSAGSMTRHTPFGTQNNHFWRPNRMPDDWGTGDGNMSHLGGNQIGNASKANTQRIKGTDRWDDLINRVSKETGVDKAIIKSIMAIESGGDARAHSHAGAVGLMQVMPNYWQGLANNYGGNLWDPYTNVRTGTQILKDAYQQHGSWDAAVNVYFTGSPNPNPSTSDGISTANQYLRMFHDNLAYLGYYGAAGGNNSGTGRANKNSQSIINEASKYMGWQYNYGGASPSTSFDCSGLTQWAFAQSGINISRTAHAQWQGSQKVSANDAAAGDLVFFERTYDNPRGERITHVGIYLGNGRMLHSGSAGVEIVDLNSEYYRSRLVGFGRY